MSEQQPTVLITGAARGVGRATATRFAAAGWHAVAGVRDLERARVDYADTPNVTIVPLDVTDHDQVRAAVAAAEERAGGALDCLVSNAGYAVMGAVEEVDHDETRRMFETNFYGALAVIQAGVPAMRRAGRGTVVVVNTVGDHLTHPLTSVYHASKYALLSITESLAFELRPFGVRVTSIEPGMIHTDFSSATRRTGAASRGEGPYAELLGQLRAGFGAWRERGQSTAEEVAEAIHQAATGDDQFRRLVGDDARELMRLREEAGVDQRAWEERLAGFLQMNWW